MRPFTTSKFVLLVSLLGFMFEAGLSSSYYVQESDIINLSQEDNRGIEAYSSNSVAWRKCDSDSPLVSENDTLIVVERTVDSNFRKYRTKDRCGERFSIILSDSYVFKLDGNVVRYAERGRNNSFKPYFFSFKEDPNIVHENGNFILKEAGKLYTSPDSGPVSFDISGFRNDGISGSTMDSSYIDFSGTLVYANEDYALDFEKPNARCKVMDLVTNETFYIDEDCVASELDLILTQSGEIFDTSDLEFDNLNISNDVGRDSRLTSYGVFSYDGTWFKNTESEIIDISREHNSVNWIKSNVIWTDEPSYGARRIKLDELTGKAFCKSLETENTDCKTDQSCSCKFKQENISFTINTSSFKLQDAKNELDNKISVTKKKLVSETSNENTEKGSNVTDKSADSTSDGRSEGRNLSTGQDAASSETEVGALFILAGSIIFSLMVVLPLWGLIRLSRSYTKGEQSNEEELTDYRKMLEPLNGEPKGNLVGQSTTVWRLMAALDRIFTSSEDYKTDRWDAKELEDLASGLESRLEDEGYDLEEFKLSGIEGYHGSKLMDGNYIVAGRGKSIVMFEIKTDSISKVKSVRLGKLTLKSGFRKVSIVGRESSGLDIELFFNTAQDRKEFLSSFKSELRSSGLSSHKNLWANEEEIKQLKKAEIGAKNNFQNMSPYEFEEFVAKLFESKGYSARTTSRSGDAGIDVIANKNGTKLAIQVKRHKETNKVGSPTVQKTLGSIHEVDADECIVVTSSYFTKPAKKRARGAPIKLWNISRLHNEIEKNMI